MIVRLHRQLFTIHDVCMDMLQQEYIIVLGRLAGIILHFCLVLFAIVVEGEVRILLANGIAFILEKLGRHHLDL